MSPQLESDSPLMAIRQKESELVQRLSLAQNEAARAITQARQEAQTMIDQAVRNGQQAGAAERAAMLITIEQEAQAILAQAQVEVERWREEAEGKVTTAVNQLIALVCKHPFSITRHDGFNESDGHHTREPNSEGVEGLP